MGLESPMGRLGLANSEAHVVAYLGSYGPCPVGRLVEVFGHRPSTLTSLLDRLVRRRLVTREVNPEDRRSVLVGLTPEGRRTAEAVRGHLLELEERIAAIVSPRDREGFEAVLRAVEEATTPEPEEEERP